MATTELPAAIEPQRVLGSRQAAAFSGYHEEHWRELHRRGKTPPAIRLSSRKYGWRVSDLIAWQDSKKDQAA